MNDICAHRKDKRVVFMATNEGSFVKEKLTLDECEELLIYELLQMDVPIIMYLIREKITTKHQLLQYNKRFYPVTMEDIEDRLEFLEVCGLIEISEHLVKRKW